MLTIYAPSDDPRADFRRNREPMMAANPNDRAVVRFCQLCNGSGEVPQGIPTDVVGAEPGVEYVACPACGGNGDPNGAAAVPRWVDNRLAPDDESALDPAPAVRTFVHSAPVFLTRTTYIYVRETPRYVFGHEPGRPDEVYRFDKGRCWL